MHILVQTRLSVGYLKNRLVKSLQIFRYPFLRHSHVLTKYYILVTFDISFEMFCNKTPLMEDRIIMKCICLDRSSFLQHPIHFFLDL